MNEKLSQADILKHTRTRLRSDAKAEREGATYQSRVASEGKNKGQVLEPELDFTEDQQLDALEEKEPGIRQRTRLSQWTAAIEKTTDEERGPYYGEGWNDVRMTLKLAERLGDATQAKSLHKRLASAAEKQLKETQIEHRTKEGRPYSDEYEHIQRTGKAWKEHLTKAGEEAWVIRDADSVILEKLRS